VSQRYHDAQRAYQDRFDTRRLADRLAESTSDTIADRVQAFIEARDMFFIATTDADGWPQSSYKGGEPGFVRILDEHTLAFPVYNGNGMYLTAGNLAVNPRVNGMATVDIDDPLIDDFPRAEFVVRVQTTEVFANCRRYVHHYELVERSRFVPRAEAPPPVPDWKLDPWFEGTLPAGDPALDPDSPSAPSIPQY